MNDDATTVLEWTFEPTDLFEEIIDVEILSSSVRIEQGVARGHFPTSEYERGAEFRDEAHRELEPHFLSQAIITGKRLVLNPAQLTREYPDGRSDRNIIVRTAHFNLSTFKAKVDFIIRDKDGNVTSNSRAERIAEQTEFRAKFVDARPGFPEIRAMADSWNKSFEDEANCFVHLYEVRDCIQTIFGRAEEAKRALNVDDDWKTIGKLSNRPDNALGRHRGNGTNHKKPDRDTLRKGRDATRRLIAAYIDHVSRS
ncbi:hypothetical protein [Roseovarius sp. Pro17]|uniref:hypothetical protein n=1 Tax=Roseovarius sp. Pro17 TaxID=3108175 RepID=UPI002D795F0B|nr:hypothetical protein [Roseovarius sp. Pro17]